MKNLLRTVQFVTGTKTADTILAPVAKIVDDLQAYVDHTQSEIVAVGEQQRRLSDRKRTLTAERDRAAAARNRVAALIS